MKQNLFVRSGRPLVSKVVYDGNLKESIERSISLTGKLDKLVEKGDTILLKPNYNTADPFPGSSDPQFIKAIIELLYEAGAGKVILGERTAFLHNRRVLEQAGIISVAEKAGAEVRVFGKDGWQVLFDRSGWHRFKVPSGQYLRKVSVAKEALEIKKIVYAPLIKTHHAAEFTGAIKLAMGICKTLLRPNHLPHETSSRKTSRTKPNNKARLNHYGCKKGIHHWRTSKRRIT